MGAFVAAKQRVEVVGRHTWLETIHGGNVSGKRVMPNSFFNEILLGKENGRFKPVPDEILQARPLYSGTFVMVGAEGRPLGDNVEAQCEYARSMKTVVVKPDRDQAALIDTMVTLDHGFLADGTPVLLPFNARTEKPIRTDEEMGEADTVLLRLNGQTQRYKIQNRNGGVLEAVGDENTFSWVSDSATLGLLRRVRDVFFIVLGRHVVVLLGGRPSIRFGVVREAAEGSAPLETGGSQLVVLRQSDGELVVRGTKEQVDAAARLIEQLRQG